MPRNFDRTDTERLALDAYLKLMRASESLTGLVSPEMQAAGLTWSQFGVLEALLHLGPLCQKELGEKLLKSTGNITMVVDNLEREGLVRRERRVEDRRYITVSLTDSGNKLIRELFPKHAKRVAELFSVLSAKEQAELAALCRTVGKQEPRE
jgi:MarR family transcriptional regulator, 2-MHQ and catechol-resistance regulon repressor